MPTEANKKPLCSVEGCNRKTQARGVCAAHYMRLRTKGSVGTEPIKQVNRKGQRKTCSVEGCDKTAKVREICTKHYQRWQKHGSTNPVTKPKTVKPRGTCTAEGCDKEVTSKGLCTYHYSGLINVGLSVLTQVTRPTCSKQGCTRPISTKNTTGLCYTHRQKLSKSIAKDDDLEFSGSLDRLISDLDPKPPRKLSQLTRAQVMDIYLSNQDYQPLAQEYRLTVLEIHQIKTGQVKAKITGHTGSGSVVLDPTVVLMVRLSEGNDELLATRFSIPLALVQEIKQAA